MAGVMTCFLAQSCKCTNGKIQTCEYSVSDSVSVTISTINGLRLGGTSRTEKLEKLVLSVNSIQPDLIMITGKVSANWNKVSGESAWPLSELNVPALLTSELPSDNMKKELLKSILRSSLKVRILEPEDTIIYKGLTITSSSIKNNTVTEYEKAL